MKGRDLIIYILEHGLEDEPIYKDGSFIGYIPASKAAEKMEVGLATVYMWVSQGRMDHIVVGESIFVSADCKLKPLSGNDI